jgi:hypothetical protein
MEGIASRLPAAMGSGAGLTVAFISFMAQVPPATCALRATAAFAVFAALGMVMRCLLVETPPKSPEAPTDADSASSAETGGRTQPTTVADLLGETAEDASSDETAAAAAS